MARFRGTLPKDLPAGKKKNALAPETVLQPIGWVIGRLVQKEDSGAEEFGGCRSWSLGDAKVTKSFGSVSWT